MSRLRSTLVVALIGAICMAAAVPREASPQPDPAAKIHVESLEVNLTQHPAFQFVVAIPTALRFEAGEVNGQRYLHIWAYSKVDSLDARIRREALYLDNKPGILTPLFDPPNRTPIVGYVDRIEFEKAVQRALRETCKLAACQNSKHAQRAASESRSRSSTFARLAGMGTPAAVSRATTSPSGAGIMPIASSGSPRSASTRVRVSANSLPSGRTGLEGIRTKLVAAAGVRS